MSNSTLSLSQAKAEKIFLKFLQDDIQNEMVISGFAGSGKSFLTRYLYKSALNLYKMERNLDKTFVTPTIRFTATTNKATSVLQNMVGMEATTVHSLLGLKVTYDFENGKTALEPTHRTEPLNNTLLFVDEASMINKELLWYIREYVLEDTNSKVVYIGDQYQLAPVMEKTSAVFREIPNIVHLEEIQRQVAGSPIIQASQLFREVLDSGIPKTWPEIVSDGKVVHLVTGPEIMNLIEDRFTQSHSPDDLKILAYTNKRVRELNSYVRRMLYGSEELRPGDTVIANSPIMALNGSVLVPGDSFLEITDITPGISSTKFAGYNVQLKGGHNVFLPENWDEVESSLKHYKKHRNWRAFYQIKNTLADLRPIHSLTCHKAQGSTYGEVFIDLQDIGRKSKHWGEVARLVYVAISRARDAVYLYGDLPVRRWKK